MKTLEKGSKKLLNAWAFYDWANSVYSLVISTAVFPIYYSSMTATFANIEGDISFLGTQWNPTTLYDYTLSFSFLKGLVAISTTAMIVAANTLTLNRIMKRSMNSTMVFILFEFLPF